MDIFELNRKEIKEKQAFLYKLYLKKLDELIETNRMVDDPLAGPNANKAGKLMNAFKSNNYTTMDRFRTDFEEIRLKIEQI